MVTGPDAGVAGLALGLVAGVPGAVVSVALPLVPGVAVAVAPQALKSASEAAAVPPASNARRVNRRAATMFLPVRTPRDPPYQPGRAKCYRQP